MSSFGWLRRLLLGLSVVLASCQAESDHPLRVSVVGDVLLARSVPAALACDSISLARRAHSWWAGSRYVLGNLECPLTAQAQPVAKTFAFRAEPRYAGWLRRLGFTHVSLANNHTFDQHLGGLRATAAAANAAQLGTLGYQADSLTGCLPTLLGRDSSVAVLAYSEFHTSGTGAGCVCEHNFTALCERLATYKTLFPQRAVLVYLHWGTEYAGQPTDVQQQQARTLIDCGAAAVVGAHPHVVQRVAFYRGRPIVYSLGNFLFDQSRAATTLALQADFDLRAGHVVATYLRPLQLVRAVPRAADAHAQAALAARLQRYSPAVQLVPAIDGRGWRLLPTDPGAEADSLPGYFERRAAVTGPTGAATARLRLLPRAHQAQVWLPTANGGASVVDFRFPIYAFGAGDVDNDGYVDLLVGPTKPTHFDSAQHRRLFVYALDSGGRLQPRWRGSRLTYRLLYFRAERGAGGRTWVRTLEQAPDGRYCIGRYHWQGFGLALDGFLAQRRSLDAAYQCFVL